MPRLSPQQQDILVHIYRQAALSSGAVFWGTEGDPVYRASISRSLRRLAARGLVQRVHHRAAGPGREPPEHVRFRTTHVSLTPAGRDLVQRLTAPGVAGC
jgi:hypothetical protein